MSDSSDRRQRDRSSPAPPKRRRDGQAFQLEDDDIRPRRLPPQPMADILGDDTTSLFDPQARGEPILPPRRPAGNSGSLRDSGSAGRSSGSLRDNGSAGRSSGALRDSGSAGRSSGALRDSESRSAALHQRQRELLNRRMLDTADDLDDDISHLRTARDRFDDITAAAYQVELMAQPYVSSSRRRSSSSSSGSIMTLIPLVIVISILILVLLGGERSTITSSWLPPFFGQPAVQSEVRQLAGSANPVGDYRLQGSPSITPAEIDRILASYGSPAVGTGAIWYNIGVSRGIDPAFAIAFFIHESSAGTARNWAGLKPDGTTTHNVGNIICAGYATCYNRFRDYPSWEVGIADWYRLIDVEYIQGRGTLTVAEIIPIYAPAFENDVQGYVGVVERMVDRWRSGNIP